MLYFTLLLPATCSGSIYSNHLQMTRIDRAETCSRR